jgi:hypothetical protein
MVLLVGGGCRLSYLFTMRVVLCPQWYNVVSLRGDWPVQCGEAGGKKWGFPLAIISRSNLKLYIFRRAFCGLAPQRLSRASSTTLSVALLLTYLLLRIVQIYFSIILCECSHFY